jgi:hypothetical protein
MNEEELKKHKETIAVAVLQFLRYVIASPFFALGVIARIAFWGFVAGVECWENLETRFFDNEFNIKKRKDKKGA